MPPRSSDAMLARYTGEIEERQQFIDGLVEAAEADQRDLTEHELELVTRARDRISTVNDLMAPLEESRRISADSAERIARLAKFMADRGDQPPEEVRYRSAGAYVLDRWRAGLGERHAIDRLDMYHRAAAHQTTADNPGLMPEPIIGPVINFIDAARPMVSALGARNLPSGNWSRPKVTQHTDVGVQTGEKTELVSRKMVIGALPVTAKTYGGYVNVSRQNIDWSQPEVMDIVINDLAAQYALETESAAAAAFAAAATAGPTLAAGADADAVAGAFWTAAALVLAATHGAGTVLAFAPPQTMGLIGPLFPPVNPQNAQSAGFNTGDLRSGPAGNVAGIPVYVTSALADDTILILSSAAAEVYEDRIGPLQVVEPSVLGVQVAYAGYFAELVIEATGLVKITATPTIP